MARTLSSTLTSAIGNTVTRPVYLIKFNFGIDNYVACWATDITANPDNESPAPTWVGSGIEVTNIDRQRASIRLPIVDAWLALALTNSVRGGSVRIYQYYYDATVSPAADSVLLFDGIMDGATFGDDIRIACIELREVKRFPPARIDFPTFTFLPISGTKITWGNDTILVN